MIRSLYKYFLAITMGTNDMARDTSDTTMTNKYKISKHNMYHVIISLVV